MKNEVTSDNCIHILPFIVHILCSHMSTKLDILSKHLFDLILLLFTFLDSIRNIQGIFMLINKEIYIYLKSYCVLISEARFVKVLMTNLS